MSVKKWLTGWVVLLAMIVVVTTPGSPSVFAEFGAVTQPIESVNAIEVELNDDYFNPKVITIPNGRTTTLILKNKGAKKHTFTVEKLGIDAEVQPGTEKTKAGSLRPAASPESSPPGDSKPPPSRQGDQGFRGERAGE